MKNIKIETERLILREYKFEIIDEFQREEEK